MRRRLLLSALLLPLAAGAPATAGTVAEPTPFTEAYAVGSAALEGARGGFVTADGLVVTLGLERLVTINGRQVEHTELQLGDLGKLAAGKGSVSGEALGQLRLIQNGELRTITPDSTALLGGTVIQNSLSDQTIRNQTAIHATVNTAGMLRSLNFGTTLNNALSTALGPR